MKIALVGDWFVPRLGGIEVQTRDLALALMARGHEVRVICGSPGEAVVEGIPVDRLPGPRLPGFGIAVTPGVFRALRKLIGEGGYDVVHVQAGNVAPIAHDAVAFCIEAGIPAVVTFHSVLKYYDWPMRWLDWRHGYSTSQVRFTAVSSVAAEPLKPLVKDKVVGILPNGIDVEWWARPAGMVKADGPIDLVSVTRLQKRKRPRWLIKAFAEALAGLPAGLARLTIVGDGDERASLERLIVRLKLSDSVVLAGRESREAIRARLHAADIFVIASRLEAFGIAALEARAAGLPVLTTTQSGSRDFLIHGVDALLAEDDAALAAHLRSVITDAALGGKLKAGAAQPPKGADWREVAPLYEAEYQAAVTRSRGSAQAR